MKAETDVVEQSHKPPRRPGGDSSFGPSGSGALLPLLPNVECECPDGPILLHHRGAFFFADGRLHKVSMSGEKRWRVTAWRGGVPARAGPVLLDMSNPGGPQVLALRDDRDFEPPLTAANLRMLLVEWEDSDGELLLDLKRARLVGEKRLLRQAGAWV